ncbi:MAG: nucleoside deaminase [Proteobacteria bacterium]|nr:nucleoside deaminase [Pseudomonadota bacterium]
MKSKKLEFLEEAIRLARESMADGRGGPFGAVIVKDGEIIARGQNSVVRDMDPTAHAEMVAIREAAKVLQTHMLSGCEIYCTCEPCPMCLSAIYWARIDAVYYSSTRDDAATAGFDDFLFYSEFQGSVGAKRVPSEQIPFGNAVSLLVDWAMKKDKIPY